MLFIAAGAFHVAKPSDLIPELQGRFPIRVELKILVEADFVRILKEPKNALLHQYGAWWRRRAPSLEFTDDGVRRSPGSPSELNERMENIGARRLQTVMTTLSGEGAVRAPGGGQGPHRGGSGRSFGNA